MVSRTIKLSNLVIVDVAEYEFVKEDGGFYVYYYPSENKYEKIKLDVETVNVLKQRFQEINDFLGQQVTLFGDIVEIFEKQKVPITEERDVWVKIYP